MIFTVQDAANNDSLFNKR